MTPRNLVFDVNETLLDLSPLDAVFESLFGDPALRATWFSSMLQWSMVTTLSGRYLDFAELAEASLHALALRRGVTLDASASKTLFETIATLPPHPEVPAALEQLRANGFTLTALTNSPQRTVDAQFKRTGLASLFTHVLSVDKAKKFKPHPEAYAVASTALDCDPSDMRLVAAHDWDVTGAMRAGCAAAFVARGESTLHPVGERPDIIGPDLASVAGQLIAIANEENAGR
jgi:2-haloacid dehalogenase